jgi:hypothetical protein
MTLATSAPFFLSVRFASVRWTLTATLSPTATLGPAALPSLLARSIHATVVARELEDRLTIEKPVDLLVADVSSATARATDFDEHLMNHNFTAKSLILIHL